MRPVCVFLEINKFRLSQHVIWYWLWLALIERADSNLPLAKYTSSTVSQSGSPPSPLNGELLKLTLCAYCMCSSARKKIKLFTLWEISFQETWPSNLSHCVLETNYSHNICPRKNKISQMKNWTQTVHKNYHLDCNIGIPVWYCVIRENNHFLGFLWF